MKELEKFKQILDSPKRIVLVIHSNPDADALGSALGLFSILKYIGNEVSVLSPNEYPEFLKWMKGNEEVIIYAKAPETK